jgi:hypothetical protein
MTDIDGEKTWKVKVFRRECDGGWNQQVLEAEYVPAVAAESTGSGTGGVPGQQGQTTAKSRTTAAVLRRRKQLLKKKSELVLDAAPRKGSIVFPKVRQRYSVCDDIAVATSGAGPAASTNTRGSNDSTTTTDKSLVVRRGDKILFVSRRRTRAMMLQFESLAECLSFTDRFLMLNHPHHRRVAYQSHKADVNVNTTTDGPSSTITLTTTKAVGSGPCSSDPRPISSDLHRQQQQKEDGAAYLVQLIHDETFLRTVGRLEQMLLSSNEGRQILEGAAKRDLAALLR